MPRGPDPEVHGIRRPGRTGAVLAACLLLMSTAGPALAHGFGRRYSLPLPLWLYVTGAAAAVGLSFVVVALFVRGTPGTGSYPRKNLLRTAWGRALANPTSVLVLQLVSASVFVLIVMTGLVGNHHPMKNLAPTFVWIIWWVGLAYVSAFAGNLWAVINPWKVFFEWAEGLYRRLRPGAELSCRLPYPAWLGTWPAVALFLAFSWVELVSGAAAVPGTLALVICAYSAITWSGMFLFGKARWLEHGEAFSLVFGLFARFAPTEVRVVEPGVCRTCSADCLDRDGECVDCHECFGRARPADRQLNLRPFAVGLSRDEAVSASKMAFVLLLLSAVTFDGFMSTPLWASIESALYAGLPELGERRLLIIRTMGLVAFPLLFFALYLAFGEAMSRAVARRLSGVELARRFVLTLVPIAIAYHLAHYFSFLLTQGQLIVPLASDPFGKGWNIFGTAYYRIDIGIVDARFEWFTVVIAIVVGHIIAVYLAHLVALRALPDRALALRSQYPMLVLMVGYTTFSLWLLAQPIVGFGT